MWKGTVGSSLSPTSSVNGAKQALDTPTVIQEVIVRFNSPAPLYYSLEVSDRGAFSLLNNDVSAGASSCVVADRTGFVAGRKVILKSPTATDKLNILSVVDGAGDTATINFDGITENAYTVASGSTVEDDRWYQVAVDYQASTVLSRWFGNVTSHVPIKGFYGQYLRFVSETENVLDVGVLQVFEGGYFDLTPYIVGPVTYSRRVDLVKAGSPLASASIVMENRNDIFNRRNPASTFIETGVNYLERPCLIQVDYLGCGADGEEGTDASGNTDWQLLCVYDMRRIQLSRGGADSNDDKATIVGETLNSMASKVEIPLAEVTGVTELIRNHVTMADIRPELVPGDGSVSKYNIAILEDEEFERPATNYGEIIGRGTFGVADTLWFDSGEIDDDEGTPLLYAGYFGMAADSDVIYTAHSIENNDDQEYSRGAVIVERYANTMPTGDVHWFFENDNADIDAGDMCIAGSTMWLHTCTFNVTKNVFKIDMTTWTLSSSYAKKGSAGHIPVHAVGSADGNSIYVLYEGGAEGRVLYKCSASDYSTTWSHTFVSADNDRIDYGRSGMVLIGSDTLLIFSKNPTTGLYSAKVYTLADSPAYATYSHSLPFDTERGIFHNPVMDNTYGDASTVLLSTGIIALIGPNKAYNPDTGGGSHRTWRLWVYRTGAFTNLGRVRFYLQNGRVINDRPEYVHPDAEKDAVNYSLEEIMVSGEVLDNGLDLESGSFSATYDDHIKTTGSYIINLKTAEILFTTPPRKGERVTANYDHMPNVQYYASDRAKRWETTRNLAQVTGGLVYTTQTGRIGFGLRHAVADHVFSSASAETFQLPHKNVIHSANTAYGQDTIKVSNAEFNIFYVQGTDFTVSYNSSLGTYTITEVGNALEGHIVFSYYTGPADDQLIVFDADGKVRPPNMFSPGDEYSDFADIYNQIVVKGEKSFPTNTPMTIVDTLAVSPKAMNADTGFSKVQEVVPSAAYVWDGDQNRFMYTSEAEQAASGYMVEFRDPFIIGTTEWRVRSPDTTQVETDSETRDGGAWWLKFTWGTSFTVTGSPAEGTTEYDAMVTNPLYWRVATPEDIDEILDQGGVPGTDKYKTGSYIYIKKFRDGGPVSDNCTAYAYKLKDTYYHIDSAHRILEGRLEDDENPTPSASPDKKIRILVEPIDATGAHLFPIAGTYDGVSIADAYCMKIVALRFRYDGLSADMYNYSDQVRYIRFSVTGYPIAQIERVKITVEDRITQDASISAIEAKGERPLDISNPFVQSAATARLIGGMLLEWAKDFHSETPLTARFMPWLELLSPCLIASDYGNFDETSELWLIDGITHTVNAGESGASTTTVYPLDIPDNPSAPPALS
jgi:hypothetical protein